MNKQSVEMLYTLETALRAALPQWKEDSSIAYYQVHQDARALRRISMTLHRWHEMECGIDNACIVRGRWNRDTASFDYDDNGKPHFEFAGGKGRSRYSLTPDRERGALKRLDAIMKAYPTLQYYIQGDPRGAALYILRPGDIREGLPIDSCYSNGIAVYK